MNGKEVEIKAEFSASQPTSALLRRWWAAATRWPPARTRC